MPGTVCCGSAVSTASTIAAVLARGQGLGRCHQLATLCLAQPGRSTEPRKKLEDGAMMQVRTPSTLERGMDLGEQATDPVGDPSDLLGQVVVVADDHLQIGQGR